MIVPRTEATLRRILSNYESKDIFNSDEFGFLYKYLPNKTYYFKGKSSSGEKIS